MESRLTKLEMDAVFQLIQLSGTSDDDFGVFWVNFPAEKDERKKDGEEEALSSSLINPENCLDDDEPLPRRKPKFGSLLDIYRKTDPLIIKNHAKKIKGAR